MATNPPSRRIDTDSRTDSGKLGRLFRGSLNWQGEYTMIWLLLCSTTVWDSAWDRSLHYLPAATSSWNFLFSDGRHFGCDHTCSSSGSKRQFVTPISPPIMVPVVHCGTHVRATDMDEMIQQDTCYHRDIRTPPRMVTGCGGPRRFL